MNTFKDVLPTFKSLVLPIEEKTPQIHELHDAIIDTIHTFLFYFCEYEKVDKLSPKQFRLFNVEDSVRKNAIHVCWWFKPCLHSQVEERKIVRCSRGLSL